MSGSGPFINSRKRAPIVLGAGRASRSAAASEPAAAISPDAANPATWTNSRLFVFPVMIAPRKLQVLAPVVRVPYLSGDFMLLCVPRNPVFDLVLCAFE